MTDENKELENNEVVEKVEEPKERPQKSKVADSYWTSVFKEYFSNLPKGLQSKLSKYFDDNYGSDFILDAKFDHDFQRKVISITIEYCKEVSSESDGYWHDHYLEISNEYSNKSIYNILKSKEDS